ncbi:type IV toxin-antitoxin system AbiEi family antitoxin domain-containing protein [Gordonia phthalatica]|uniref:AbiEi antitoxin C-terminal domain-containing protein n=1 Tax=Gordonia phthalatica TaxID=1136941 RepID=A0A0N9N4E4_9ACTN|nr:type IV toxin-antitoxin system AbiEi family antitoxin domain-containing protein [Gordonia phthalatica]ALG85681.1 hypothetical protein ACH46_15845 [Gordonia phthalatica]
MLAVDELPVDEFGLIRRAAALDAGWSDTRLIAAVRRGELIHLAPGVYVRSNPWFVTESAGRDELYRLRGLAAVTSERCGNGVVLSHQSAAAQHGISLLKSDTRYVHVTRDARSGGGRRAERQLHAVSLPDCDVVDLGRFRVTSMERTAVDVATDGATFAQALTVFDMALARGASREVMTEMLAGRRNRGVKTARRALYFASSLSESVGESWSRAQMIDADIRFPVLQCTHIAEGHEYRSDFDWECRLVGEFDGKVKYGRLRKPGETIEQAVMREKEREDRLRSIGIMVIRWIWSDLENNRMIPRVQYWLERFDRLPMR